MGCGLQSEPPTNILQLERAPKSKKKNPRQDPPDYEDPPGEKKGGWGVSLMVSRFRKAFMVR